VEGVVQALSASVPGTTSDLELLDQSAVIKPLEPAQAAGLDKGYGGVDKRYPEHAFPVRFEKPRGGKLPQEQKSYNRAPAKARIVVEHLVGRLPTSGRSTRSPATARSATARWCGWGPGWSTPRSSGAWPQGRRVPERRDR
jgi:hypothetical protein